MKRLKTFSLLKACLVAQRSYVSFEGERNLSDILGYTQESELIIRDFISRLEKVDQEILTMKLQGVKHTVIAKHVGCTANNIKHRLNKIRENIMRIRTGIM